MRRGWLYYWQDNFVILEGYNPKRAARQFDFFQATPLDGILVLLRVTGRHQLSSLSSSTRLEVASLTWAFLLRLGTGSNFLITHMDASTGIAHLRLFWIRHTFSSFKLGIRRYSRRIQGSRRSRRSSGPRDYAPVHAESSRVRSRRRKRSPKLVSRYFGPAPLHRCRPISPSLDKGHPRSRTSFDMLAYRPTPANLPGSPILEPIGPDTPHIPLSLYEFPPNDEGSKLPPELQPREFTPVSPGCDATLSPALEPKSAPGSYAYVIIEWYGCKGSLEY
ncbi:hypothetical protein MA16_Dca015476 [Dendrobium catenatum]|uniref:Uncharacterized protein n=1 Tax=Dendrobium catenatum TaxID=906689 RepID=A0A2I0X9K7_9ASPA|nr:hypothetical protein MA16_Dca015476 [Dendrobium catenatum]